MVADSLAVGAIFENYLAVGAIFENYLRKMEKIDVMGTDLI